MERLTANEIAGIDPSAWCAHPCQLGRPSSSGVDLPRFPTT